MFDRIYLQVDEGGDGPEAWPPEGVTWCEDRMNDNDIEYVRADKAGEIQDRQAGQNLDLETRLAENEKGWQADVDTMHGLADDLEKAEARIAKLVANAAKLSGKLGMLRLQVEGLAARHQCLIEMAQRIRRVAENDITLMSFGCVQAMCDVLGDHEAILEGEGK